MTTEEAILSTLKSRMDNFDQIEPYLINIMGDWNERKSGKFEDKVHIGLRSMISKLKSKYQDGDEIWFFDNIVPPLSGYNGFALIRNGKIAAYEIVLRS